MKIKHTGSYRRKKKKQKKTNANMKGKYKNQVNLAKNRNYKHPKHLAT